MSIFSWVNKMLGIDNSNDNNDIPSEFQLPPTNTINKTEHFTVNRNFNDAFEKRNPFEDVFENDFEDSIHLFNLNIENFLRKLELEFGFHEIPTNNENNIFLENGNLIELSKEGTYNIIPKNNFIAHDYFVNSRPVLSRSYELPVEVKKSNFGQASTSSYIFGNWNGRMIEQETRIKQLQDGTSEKIIVMKDGKQSCTTTITENLKTGEQNTKKQLINLDEGQLSEFENRFSMLNFR